jgi:hypothetical protein
MLYFSIIYSAVAKTIDYVVKSRYGRVSSRAIDIVLPSKDKEGSGQDDQYAEDPSPSRSQ